MNSPKLYVLARCIKNISDPELYKLLSGYFEAGSSDLPLLIENVRDVRENKIRYDMVNAL